MKNNSQLKLLSVAALTGVTLILANFASAETASPAKGTVRESVRAGFMITPDGEKAVTSIDRKWDEQSGTGTLNEAAATKDGRVATREANLTRNSDGTITARGTFTDFDGRSFNYAETTKHTAMGDLVTGRMIDEAGRVSTYETTSAKAPRNQIKSTTVITHADGAKESRVEMLSPARAASRS